MLVATVRALKLHGGVAKTALTSADPGAVERGLGNLAKHDPQVMARPEDFEITVRDVILAAGAGYVVPLLGDIVRMPGLPSSPQAERMDLVDGEVTYLAREASSTTMAPA